MKMSLEVFGDQVFNRELLNMERRGMDMRPAFDSIHNSFLGIEQSQFASQGATGQRRWAPLQPATVAAKQQLNLDPRILHATLRLRNSLAQRTHPDHIFRTTDDEMFVGSNVEYGVHHQFGAPRAKLPARPPVSLTERHKRNWIKTLQRYLVEGVTA